MGQLAGPRPGEVPPGTKLGEAAPFEAFSPTRPADGPPPGGGRLGSWFPDEAELRTWGGADLLTAPATADVGALVNGGVRLVQARFPLPLPLILSAGATDPGGPVPWLGAIFFRVQIGVAAGQHIVDLFKVLVPPPDGVFFNSQTMAARSVVVDAFFVGPLAVPVSARVWAGVAPFG